MKTDDASAARLRVGGFLPFTGVDYPGALAAVVFCQGCPLRCVYCHNQALLPARGTTRIEWQNVHAHIAARRGLLDAVVFSGGEPLMQRALLPAMQAVKNLGFRIGLHTSGIAPDRLGAILHLLDWVGFDVKASFDDYEKITGVKGSGEKAHESLAMLAVAGIDTEVRTTIWPGVTDVDEVRQFADDINNLGIKTFAVQEARDALSKAPIGGDIFFDSTVKEELGRKFSKFTIRRAA